MPDHVACVLVDDTTRALGIWRHFTGIDLTFPWSASPGPTGKLPPKK
ncbi:MAG: hypothetical protein R2875_06990 [Desulfobacterales bacterium]